MFDLTECNGGADCALAEEINKMRNEGHVSPVTDFLARVSFWDVVADMADGYWMLLSRHWFEKGRPEWKYSFASRARALGEQYD